MLLLSRVDNIATLVIVHRDNLLCNHSIDYFCYNHVMAIVIFIIFCSEVKI